MSRSFSFAVLACLSLVACQTSDVTNGDGALGGLAIDAAAAIVPPPAQNVRVTATVTNISTNALAINYGGCAVTPVFRTGSLNGQIVYDPRPTQACTAAITTKSLDPNQSVQIVGSAVPNLPAGKYFVATDITINGQTIVLGAGTVTF